MRHDPSLKTAARSGQAHAPAGALGSAKDFVSRSGPSPYALQRFAATLTSHGGLSACFWLLAFGASGVAVKGRPDGAGFDKIRLGGLAVLLVRPSVGGRRISASAHQRLVSAPCGWRHRRQHLLITGVVARQQPG